MSTHIPVNPKKGKAFVSGVLRALDGKERFAVLATQDGAGHLYASLISFVFTEDLREIVFPTPKKTRKYRNLLSAKEVALLIDNRSETGGDIMETEAITVVGRARPLRKGGPRDSMEAIFLEKHPGLEEFVRSPSTALVSIEVNEYIHVSRFQTVSVWRPDWGKK